MTITERVAYLKGLIEGLGIDETQKEGKVIKVMAEILDDLAFSVADIEDGITELGEQVEAIDEDLNTLEEEYYSEFDDDDDDFDDNEQFEVECPACGETLCIDEDMLELGEMDCPNCGERLEFDFDECDCGCEDCCDHEEE